MLYRLIVKRYQLYVFSIIQNKYIIILFHSQKLVHAAYAPNLVRFQKGHPPPPDVLVVLSRDCLLRHLGIISPCAPGWYASADTNFDCESDSLSLNIILAAMSEQANPKQPLWKKYWLAFSDFSHF